MGAQITFLHSPADLPLLADWLSAGRSSLAFDTETTGLDVFEPGFTVGVCAFADRDGNVFAFDGRNTLTARAAIRLAFGSGRNIWAHNAKYDAWVIRRTLTLKLTSLRCSEVAARTARPGLMSYSLKKLRPTTQAAQDALKARWQELSPARVIGGERSWLPVAVRHMPADDPAMLAYVAEDAVETARLVQELAADREVRPFIETELAADQLWRWTGYAGLNVDTGFVAAQLVVLEEEKAAAEERFGLAPWANTNARREWVADRGIVLPLTQKGGPSFEKKLRSKTQVPDDQIEAWAEFTAAIDLNGTVSKLNELLRKAGAAGVVHPGINVNRARTGRMSVQDPALQNLKGSLRQSLLARPGFVLVGADLSHVEPSIMAAVSQDALLARHCDADHDVYVETAAVVWGDGARATNPDGGLTAEAARFRKKAKVVFLALGYGMGDASFGTLLGVSKGEAKVVRAKVLGVYRDLGAWIQRTRRAAKQGQVPRTLSGRPLPLCPGDLAYRATNFVIQGSAKDVFSGMVTAVAARLPAGARLWLPVHDELVVECLPADVRLVGEILAECMQATIGAVHIHGSPEYIGPRWAKEGVSIAEAPIAA